MHLDQVFLLFEELHHLEEFGQVHLHDELFDHRGGAFSPQLGKVVRDFFDSFDIFVLQVVVQ